MYRILIFLFVLSFFSGCSEPVKKDVETELTRETDPQGQKSENRENIIKFWQSLSQQKVDDAVLLANSLVKNNSGKVSDFYKDLFKKEGVKDSLIARDSFNKVDAFFWAQAQFFKTLVNDALLGKADQDPVELLYKLVCDKIESKSDTKDVGSYPLHIWQRGFGACDRQSWVLCELAYQLGANASIVYLRNPETLVSPHTICEIVYRDKHYIIDVLNKKFLPNTKFIDLSSQKIKEIWTEKPELHNTFEKYVRLIPSMPTDYAERNQRLTAYLGNLIRFGEPPQNRFHFWKELYPKEDTRFWGYAIKVLKNFELYQNEEK